MQKETRMMVIPNMVKAIRNLACSWCDTTTANCVIRGQKLECKDEPSVDRTTDDVDTIGRYPTIGDIA